MRILVTFLGRVPKKEGTYRTTEYEFSGADFGATSRTPPVAFFGWPLTRQLRPDRLVILGTSGSMWDHLFEVDHDLGDRDTEERSELIDATSRSEVLTEHITPLEPLLKDALEKQLRKSVDVRLSLIPYCRTEAEQVEVLRLLSGHVEAEDEVHIDITHGFRTLPMLSVLAALYLRRVRRVKIKGIWYGFYDPDTGDAPVQNLLGLLHIADWLEALTVYEHDGDYGAFVRLIGSAGGNLRKAAFFERTSNPIDAKEHLDRWARDPGRIPSGDAAADLFEDQLLRRVDWRRGPDRAAWERDLARIYLDKGDYVRATTYGTEAVVTQKAIDDRIDHRIFSNRERIRQILRASNCSFESLADLRNQLAHGRRRPAPNIGRAMESDGNMKEFLEDLFEDLF